MLAREDVKHRLRSRFGGQRGVQIGWHLDAGRTGIGRVPPSVGLRAFDFGHARRVHPSRGDQARHDSHVARRPRTTGPSGGEALPVGAWSRRVPFQSCRSADRVAGPVETGQALGDDRDADEPPPTLAG